MSKKLFVGNIDWNSSEDDLQSMFSPYGEIEEVVIIKDKYTNRSKGFGFITFSDDADADKAVAELNGYKLNNREIVVNEARPPKQRNSY